MKRNQVGTKTCYIQEFENTPGPCPQCSNESWTQSRETYCVAVETKKGTYDSYMMSGSFGWFCGACDTVVLSENQMAKNVAMTSALSGRYRSFRVIGTFVPDAVPDDKRNMPFGDKNPVPLCRFLYAGEAHGVGDAFLALVPGWGSEPVGRVGSEPIRTEKLPKNAPCWCGSGRKYKKCHMTEDLDRR